MRTWLAVALLLLPGATRADGFSWRGHPQAGCSSFLITESGLLGRVGGSTTNPYIIAKQGAPTTLVQFELGAMANVAPQDAVGGACFTEIEGDVARAGVRFRYRRWVEPTVALDIEPGITFFGDHWAGERFPSFSGRMSLSARDIAGFDVVVEQFRTDPTPTQTAIYFGFHLGAKPGAAVMPIYALVRGYLNALEKID